MMAPFGFERKGGRPQWTLTFPHDLYLRLHSHLFRGDNDEHGAIIKAGIQLTTSGYRLLVRDVVLANDGTEFVPGTEGYRMLTGEFVSKHIVQCRNEQLAYLAVHNHGGNDSVGFSVDDLASQAKGYPALLDIVNGPPVGAVVFAKNAIAGRLWLSASDIIDLTSANIIGPSFQYLYPAPRDHSQNVSKDYDRQSRLFGDRGQEILANLTVGVIGAGGVGSLIIEYLARLGVGRFVIADPDRLDLTNLPRVTGATRFDAMAFFTKHNRPAWLRQIGQRLSAKKVNVMKRIIHKANPNAHVEVIFGDFVDENVARRFLKCDYLVNAADSLQARLVFNAIVHAYLIPGVDLGAKVPVDKETGTVGDVRAVVHPVLPGCGCLLCNGFIPSGRLQQEMETPVERRFQRYVDDKDIVAPSVITLNALAASHAVNDFLFSVTGLTYDDSMAGYLRILPRSRRIVYESPRKDELCPHCSTQGLGLFAQGNKASLPTRQPANNRRK